MLSIKRLMTHGTPYYKCIHTCYTSTKYHGDGHQVSGGEEAQVVVTDCLISEFGIFKLRLGASRTRSVGRSVGWSVGWSVGLSVLLGY